MNKSKSNAGSKATLQSKKSKEVLEAKSKSQASIKEIEEDGKKSARTKGKESPRTKENESAKNEEKGRDLIKDAKDNNKDASNDDDQISKDKPAPEPEIPVEDVRKHILQHYGISAEEEKEKKEKRANKFRDYVQNSGLQLAFQLVISEVLAKGIAKDEVFKYASNRFKEIGKEYSSIVIHFFT